MRRLAAVVVLSAAVLAGCGGGGGPATGEGHRPGKASSAEPKTAAAARSAAQDEFGAFASGDWVGAWDLYDKAGQKAISRTDYVRLHTECKPVTGVPFVIKSVRLESPTKAIVDTSRSSFLASYTMVYESGHWLFQPDTDTLASYAKGVDAAVAAEKAAKQCQ